MSVYVALNSAALVETQLNFRIPIFRRLNLIFEGQIIFYPYLWFHLFLWIQKKWSPPQPFLKHLNLGWGSITMVSFKWRQLPSGHLTVVDTGHLHFLLSKAGILSCIFKQDQHQEVPGRRSWELAHLSTPGSFCYQGGQRLCCLVHMSESDLLLCTSLLLSTVATG